MVDSTRGIRGCVDGSDVFAYLQEKFHSQQFDDEYLLLAIKFRELYPESAGFEIFMDFMRWRMAMFRWHLNRHGLLLASVG